MKTFTSLVIAGILIPNLLFSQNFGRDIDIPVTINNLSLENPWAGGMEAPEYSAIDLNGDNIKDLFVFDRQSNRIATFINNGTPGQIDYHYAPQFITAFPPLSNWAQLVDYNCDGKEDIFTHAIGGIAVYKNISASSLQFTMKDSLIHSSYSGFIANLYTASQNLASFTDIDDDSDLDILTTSVMTGLEFHKNLSFDLYGTCDSLIFVLDTSLWGRVLFQGGGNESRNYLAIDIDGDSDKDLLTNNIAQTATYNLDYIKLYENTGNATVSNLILAIDTFPNILNPAHIRGFAGVFELDADNDSQKDLIISPQMGSMMDVNNSWFLKDTSSTSVKSFENIMNNFICGGMIDVGTIANVRFSDIDNDGLMDIIIGNMYRFPENENDSSSLYFFRNTGTASTPAFTLITDNFANSKTIPFTGGLSPAFGDLDGDLDNDMLVGKNDGTLDFYENNNGNFSLVTGSFMSIDAGMANAPYLFDVNQDGLIDLICGNRMGKLQYFQNSGTLLSPIFTLVNATWGDVEVVGINSVNGYSYPVIYLLNGSLELLVGSEEGTIFRYGNITGNLNGTFALLDSSFGGINEIKHLTIDVADINNDSQLDILTGNFNGGAVIYKQLPVAINEIENIELGFEVFPNPASTTVTIKGTPNMNFQVFNIIGEMVFENTVEERDIFKIDISGLKPGIYFVRAGSKCQKLVVHKP